MLMFSKYTLLISIPDISKWNTQNLEEMIGIFSDCYLLLYSLDLSKWYNYNNKNYL